MLLTTDVRWNICLYSENTLPCSQRMIGLTTVQLLVILFASCQHLCTLMQWGGMNHFVFYKPNNNSKCRWVPFPLWHQYHFRCLLLRCGSRAGLSVPPAIDDACSIPQSSGWRTIALVPSCLRSPSPLLSRPITNSLLRYNDIEFWQLRDFFLLTPLYPFFFHPSFSFSV